VTSRDFCFWLQGFFELNAKPGEMARGLTDDQAEMVRRHLALVFKHEIDPSMGPKDVQEALNKLHENPGFHNSGVGGGPILRC
jgi:hypothetical protein